jgi:hypothetical protein
MREGAETTFDGKTLVGRIPMRFQRRGGRKRIVAPNGSAIVASDTGQRKAVAEAIVRGALAQIEGAIGNRRRRRRRKRALAGPNTALAAVPSRPWSSKWRR